VARLDLTALPEYEELRSRPARALAPAESRRFVETVLWLAGGQLRRTGWVLHKAPGERIAAHRADGSILVPTEILSALGSGAITAEEWRRECVELGIGHLDLSVSRQAPPGEATEKGALCYV
jgi:hypothetical protein